MNKKQQRKINNEYYKSILLQFLGMEKELFTHTEHSVRFIHDNQVLILWMGANKIQDTRSVHWIDDADKFIIDKVLKQKNVPYLNESSGTMSLF